MRNQLYNISLIINDFAQGYSIRDSLQLLRRSQYWSRDRLVEYQNQRLRLLIEHAYANVPFYREIFDQNKIHPTDVQNVDDLHKLPILSKELIRQGIRSGKLFSKIADRKRIERLSSSGSTGSPLQFYIDKSAVSMSKACAIRSWEWMGFKPGMKILRINYLERRKLIKRIQDYASNNTYFRFTNLNESELDHIARVIRQVKPDIIRCYPEPLVIIAKFLQRKYQEITPIHLISTTGSNLYQESRTIIENVFNGIVFDAFGCEGGAGVFECDTHNTYHSSMEYAITEVIGSAEQPNMGNLITTDLWNYCCPFIRYDTQDVIEIDNSQCSCGRGLYQIKRIIGRDSDALETPSKGRIWTTTLVGLLQDFGEINQFQLVQDKSKSLTIKLEVNESFSNESSDKVLSLLQGVLGADLPLSIEIVDHIPILPNGKRKMLDREF